MSLKAIATTSGGKDSNLAIYKALKDGVDIKMLLNFISIRTNRGCFHGLTRDLITAQAECIGIPIYVKPVSPDMQQYEMEFKDAVKDIKSNTDINAMVFGDISLVEHKEWVERVCFELNITPIEPLWGRNPKDIVSEFINCGFKAKIVSCKADIFGDYGYEIIGRDFDWDIVNFLEERNICLCGESGEFHTFVYDGPTFKKRINIIETEKLKIETFWTAYLLEIKKYEIQPK